MKSGRWLIIVAVISLVLTVYFFVVGWGWHETEALKMGWMSAILSLICFSLYLRIYFSVKKIIMAVFREYAKDGKLDFSVELIGDESIEITRMFDGKVIVINKSEVKAIYQLKTTNLIVLSGKRIFDLPNREDINELIKPLYRK